jgi:hypothetical protein
MGSPGRGRAEQQLSEGDHGHDDAALMMFRRI